GPRPFPHFAGSAACRRSGFVVCRPSGSADRRPSDSAACRRSDSPACPPPRERERTTPGGPLRGPTRDATTSSCSFRGFGSARRGRGPPVVPLTVIVIVVVPFPVVPLFVLLAGLLTVLVVLLAVVLVVLLSVVAEHPSFPRGEDESPAVVLDLNGPV